MERGSDRENGERQRQEEWSETEIMEGGRGREMKRGNGASEDITHHNLRDTEHIIDLLHYLLRTW